MESAGHVKLPLPSMPQAAVTKALRRVYCSAGVKLIVNNNCKAGRQKLERRPVGTEQRRMLVPLLLEIGMFCV